MRNTTCILILWGTHLLSSCVLLESLLHLFAASLRRLHHPKSHSASCSTSILPRREVTFEPFI
ncbi:hypothetical protein HID58_067900 [Brassica napus]|uniref:Secreted protein n=1 Tax=Brassica napus TaxID=3708 RepID=A0ABQ7ZKE7_BRANA|nr:hypothetical protein HID58_067900 [Brassica napus]